jgi:type VI secretion system VgrG family protein
MEQLHRAHEWTHYRATLVPRLWKLSCNHRSRVFPDMTVPEIIQKVLEDNGLREKTDFTLDLKGDYPRREHCIQYKETDLHFIQRLMEYEGLYYFFSMQTSSPDADKPMEGEILRIMDDRSFEDETIYDGEAHYQDGLLYQPDTGALMSETERITHFTVRQQVVTGGVQVRDYDHTDLKAVATSEGESKGPVQGTYYEHGPFYRGARAKSFEKAITSEDPVKQHDEDRKGHIGHIARVRQQEFQAQQNVMHGQSNSPGVQSGWRFGLKDHYRGDLNQQYLVTRVQHEGAQRGHMPGLRAQEEMGYGNAFTCIPEGVQYRPPRNTPVPQVPGIITANVESEGGAEDPPFIDEEGRYRVRMPFDQRDESGGPDADEADLGKASQPVTMAQPYSGPDYGMHFPNHAGTRMVVACLEGNPDQPIGLSTMPTPWNHTPAPVKTDPVSTTERTNIIRTFTNNQLILEDEKEKHGIRIFTPNENSIAQLGAPVIQDPPYDLLKGISLATDNSTEVHGKKGVIINAGDDFVPQIPTFKDNVENIELLLDAIAAAVGKKFKRKDLKALKGELKAAYDEWKEGLNNPSVYIEGKDGIGMHSEASLLVYTAEGIDLFTSEGVDIGAKTGIRIATNKGGTNIFVKEGGINMRTYKNDVLGRTEKGGIKLVAGDVSDLEDVDKGDIKAHAEKNAHYIAKEGDVNITSEEKDINEKAKKNVNIEAEEESGTFKAKKEITIEAGEKILLTCGKSSIELRENGTILIRGKNINVEADQKVEVNAKMHIGIVCSKKNVDVEGKMGVNIEGMKVNSKAKVMNKTEGKVVNSKASAASILKGGIVKIN